MAQIMIKPMLLETALILYMAHCRKRLMIPKQIQIMTGQLIGLVSLFSALAFLVFGGINLLSSLIELADTRYAADMLSAGCVWLWAMGNIFLLFVHFMLIISGKSKDFKLKWYIVTINAIPAAIFLIVQILDNLNWI